RKATGTGQYPCYDIRFDLPSSFAQPRKRGLRPIPRVWPYPFRAGFTFANDNHSLLDRDQWLQLYRWFNTSDANPVHGTGLDMEVTSSIWAYTSTGSVPSWGVLNKFSYYEPLNRANPQVHVKEADAAVIRQL